MDKELTREILQKGEALLREFANTLGSTAKHVYEVLVRQQLVEGISGIIMGVLGVIILIIGVKFFQYAYGKFSKYYDKDEYDYGIACFMSSAGATVAVCLVLFISSTTIAESIKRIINPEYYAIEFIVDSVQKKEAK